MNIIHVKQLHVICVILTFVSFSVRGYWMIIGSALLKRRLTRILPHIIDTLLLLSGISLAIVIYGEFYRHTWLMIKLGAVVVYIILGAIAIRYGKTKTIRIGALVLSWGTFFYIIILAGYNSIFPIGVFGI